MKITDLKVVYLCPDHNEKYHRRKMHMDTMLNQMGFKDIVHYKSGTESYPTCLSLATKNILMTYLDEPILFLEDDVEPTGIVDVEYIDNVDAIYVGLSNVGGHSTENIHEGLAQFEQYSNSQARILNMLSGHAIVYNTRRYKEAVIEAMNECIEKKLYNDVAISRIQKNYLVLANKIPSFYQSLKFNEEQKNPHENVEIFTKIFITDDLKTTPLLYINENI